MYSDLTEDEAISLYIDHVCKGLPVPVKLQELIPDDVLQLLRTVTNEIVVPGPDESRAV